MSVCEIGCYNIDLGVTKYWRIWELKNMFDIGVTKSCQQAGLDVTKLDVGVGIWN